jgi:CBS domain-containing protein
VNTDIISNGTSLVPGLGGLRDAMMPKSFGEVLRFAELVQHGAFVPKEFRGKPGEIVAAVTYGAEIGLTPMQSLQCIGVINGKPVVYGDGPLAVCQGHPAWNGMEERIEGAGEQRRAVCVVRRKGDSDARYSFSVADARKAGLLSKPGPWAQYPDRMLQMRARGFALRDQFADALRGIITEHEARDYPTGPDTARDVTPRGPIADPAEVLPDAYDPITGVVGEPLTYDLDGDEFESGDWLMEADTRRRSLSNGELREWVERHRSTWRLIADQEPEQREAVEALTAGIRQQVERAKAEQPELIEG